MPRGMPTVLYNSANEFLTELATDKDLVVRKIVRVTKQRRSAAVSPNVFHIHLVATCEVVDQVLKLDAYMGDILGFGHSDEEVQKKTEERQAKLEERIIDLGLEVRGGMLEVS